MSSNNSLINFHKYSSTLYYIIVFILFCSFPLYVSAQNKPNITVKMTADNLYAGHDITLSFQVDSATSAYYFGVELGYDSQKLKYISSKPGAIMGDSSLCIAGVKAPDTLAASATRTSGVSTGGGVLLNLTFHIADDVKPGPVKLAFSKMTLLDSTEKSIPVNYSTLLDTAIIASITDARLNFNNDTLIVGNQIPINSEVLSQGITDQKGVGQGIKCWIGFSQTNTNPKYWDESHWKLANYQKDDSDYDVYQAFVGSDLTPGTYYVAARFQLNNQNYVYGGYNPSGGGIWDNTTYKSGTLVIKKKPPYQTKLVEWNFDDDNFIADKGILANSQDTLKLVGASVYGWISGAEGDALNTNGWDDTTITEYYEIHINTTHFKNIRVFSKQSSSNTGPREFTLEYSLNQQHWNSVKNVTLGDDWTTGVVSAVQLPDSTSNQKDLYIRWRKSSVINVKGDTTSGRGTSKIDNIVVTGVDNNPTTVTIWPGDTNNDNVVDETDVLPLGEYWMLSGPPRDNVTLNWGAKQGIGWRPENVSYADADGNGIVNQLDLFPIGKNYGKKVKVSKVIANGNNRISAYSNWPKVKAGDHLEITVKVNRNVSITGVSCDYSLTGNDANNYSLDQPVPGNWIQKWEKQHTVLTFNRKLENGNAVAWVHKGICSPVTTSDLFTFGITVKNKAFRTSRLEIKRLSILDSHNQIVVPDSVEIEVSKDNPTSIETDDGVIRKTKLMNNYPNPFNPTTNIRYELAHNGKVKLIIYNILGREVSELVNKVQSSGRYEVTWNARHAASGVYLYRLYANGKVFTRKMVLVK